MRNVLLAERAWEKEAADAKARGLPPPPRVFEQVNGPDRARQIAPVGRPFKGAVVIPI